jgi:hypothetical protein
MQEPYAHGLGQYEDAMPLIEAQMERDGFFDLREVQWQAAIRRRRRLGTVRPSRPPVQRRTAPRTTRTRAARRRRTGSRASPSDDGGEPEPPLGPVAPVLEARR